MPDEDLFSLIGEYKLLPGHNLFSHKDIKH
jgi:hypothetical protein